MCIVDQYRQLTLSPQPKRRKLLPNYLQFTSAVDVLPPEHLVYKPTFSSSTRQASYLALPFTESSFKQFPSQCINSGYEETFTSLRGSLII